MEPLHEALRLIERQAELENAMRRPGGIRVTEERELHQLRDALAQFPAAVTLLIDVPGGTNIARAPCRIVCHFSPLPT